MDQNLGSPLIYFFYMHTIIWQKYVIFFHLFFFFCARPFDQKLWSTLIYFFVHVQPFDQKLRSSLIYLFYLYTIIRPNIRVLIDFLFSIFTQPFEQIIWGKGGGRGVVACGTSNYRNPVCKFAKFLFTEPIEWKTSSPAKLLIECNSGRNK